MSKKVKIINQKAQIEVISGNDFLKELIRLSFIPESDEINDFLNKAKSFKDDSYIVTEEFSKTLVEVISAKNFENNILYKNYNNSITALKENYIEGSSVGFESAILSLKSFIIQEFPKFNFKKDYFFVTLI